MLLGCLLLCDSCKTSTQGSNSSAPGTLGSESSVSLDAPSPPGAACAMPLPDPSIIERIAGVVRGPSVSSQAKGDGLFHGSVSFTLETEREHFKLKESLAWQAPALRRYQSDLAKLSEGSDLNLSGRPRVRLEYRQEDREVTRVTLKPSGTTLKVDPGLTQYDGYLVSLSKDGSGNVIFGVVREVPRVGRFSVPWGLARRMGILNIMGDPSDNTASVRDEAIKIVVWATKGGADAVIAMNRDSADSYLAEQANSTPPPALGADAGTLSDDDKVRAVSQRWLEWLQRDRAEAERTKFAGDRTASQLNKLVSLQILTYASFVASGFRDQKSGGIFPPGHRALMNMFNACTSIEATQRYLEMNDWTGVRCSAGDTAAIFEGFAEAVQRVINKSN